MSKMKSLGVTVGLGAAALLAFGCAAAPVGDAPSVEDEALDVQDYGTIHNNWEMWPFARTLYRYDEFYQVEIIERSWGMKFTRYSGGDSTRGGGSCLVYPTGVSNCTSDASCGGGQADGSYKYCSPDYSDPNQTPICWHRPGTPAEMCTVGQNRAPGTYTGGYNFDLFHARANANGNVWVLGCMTKAAGPSAACGGTNSSLYMRTVTAYYDELEAN